MNHVVDRCPLTKFEGSLQSLNEADDKVYRLAGDYSTREMKSTMVLNATP